MIENKTGYITTPTPRTIRLTQKGINWGERKNSVCPKCKDSAISFTGCPVTFENFDGVVECSHFLE